MAKRIGSTAWRVGVGEDGKIFSLGVRSESGLSYEVLLGVVDSTPIVTDLLSEIARVHQSLPRPTFGAGDGPHHPKSVPLQPLETRVEGDLLLLDFGGAVLKVRIEAEDLRRQLANPGTPA